MTLSTHAIAGTAVASLLPGHPWLAFVAAFISHFLLDSIPHRDYDLASYRAHSSNYLENDLELGPAFIRDMAKIGLDCTLGIFLSFSIFYATGAAPFSIVCAGIIGGMLPDALQFVYMKTRSSLLAPLQRFHFWVHGKRELKLALPLSLAVQASFSACLVMAALSLAKLLVLK